MKTNEEKLFQVELEIYYEDAIDFICSRLIEKFGLSQAKSDDLITLSCSEPIEIDIVFRYGYNVFFIYLPNKDEETIQIVKNFRNEIYDSDDIYFEYNIKNLIISKRETTFSTSNTNKATFFYSFNIGHQIKSVVDYNAFYESIENLKKYDPKFIVDYQNFDLFIEFVKAIEDSFYENYPIILKLKDNPNFDNIKYFPDIERYIVRLLYFTFVDKVSKDEILNLFHYDIVCSPLFQITYLIFSKHKNKIERNVKLNAIMSK